MYESNHLWSCLTHKGFLILFNTLWLRAALSMLYVVFNLDEQNPCPHRFTVNFCFSKKIHLFKSHNCLGNPLSFIIKFGIFSLIFSHAKLDVLSLRFDLSGYVIILTLCQYLYGKESSFQQLRIFKMFPARLPKKIWS